MTNPTPTDPTWEASWLADNFNNDVIEIFGKRMTSDDHDALIQATKLHVTELTTALVAARKERTDIISLSLQFAEAQKEYDLGYSRLSYEEIEKLRNELITRCKEALP
jgi:hypothetical protein